MQIQSSPAAQKWIFFRLPRCSREENMDCYVPLALPSVPANLACVGSVPRTVFCSFVGTAQMSQLGAELCMIPAPQRGVQLNRHCQEGTQEHQGQLRAELCLKHQQLSRSWSSILSLELGREAVCLSKKEKWDKKVLSPERGKLARVVLWPPSPPQCWSGDT